MFSLKKKISLPLWTTAPFAGFIDIPHRSSGEPPGRVLGQLPVSVEEQLPSSLRAPVLQPAPEHLPSSSRYSSVLQLRHVLLPKSVENRQETDKRPADCQKHTHEEGFQLSSVMSNISSGTWEWPQAPQNKVITIFRSRYDIVVIWRICTGWYDIKCSLLLRI